MKKEDNRLEKSEAFDWKAEIISWIKIIIAAAVIAFVLNNFIIANSKVPSGSMENTIMTGDRVIGLTDSAIQSAATSLSFTFRMIRPVPFTM